VRLRAPQAQNLDILPRSGYLSGRYGDGFNNEGTPFVAILALCNMTSADTVISLSGFQMD